MTAVISSEMLSRIKKLAAKEVKGQDKEFCAIDFSGGNFDDAWESGARDGESLHKVYGTISKNTPSI